jgi:hypothetical protein
MKAAKFYSTRNSPKPPSLPQGLLDELREEIRCLQDDPLEIHWQSVSEILRDKIKSSGLSWEELCERMRKPEGKTEITPQYLDTVLSQDSPETWLQIRILKALQIQWDDFRRIVKANDEIMSKAYDRNIAHVKALKSYAKYGPHLFGLFKAEERSPYCSASKPPEFRQLNMKPEKDPFNPPSAEAVGQAIAKHLASRPPQADNERYPVAAYRYHRLPNEIYDFDLQGNLLASGNANMEAPPGLMVVKISGRCGCCYMPMRKVVPPALLQQVKLKLAGKSPSKSRKPRR